MSADANERENKCARAVEVLRDVFGEQLRAVILYGSAVGADYVPGRSDINLLVVLQDASPRELQTLRGRWKEWHRLGLDVPLVVDEQFLVRAADVFPLELIEIRERHRLLFGKPVLALVEVSLQNVRHQVEFELRSKALRLQALYLNTDLDRAVMQEALLSSAKSFVVLMKHLLYLKGESGPFESYAQVVERFATRFSLSLSAVQLLLAIRREARPWPTEIEPFVREYLGEIHAVIRVADTIEQGEMRA